MSTTGDAALDRVLRALHALADDRAQHLVGEAWARAEADVADTLTDAMRAVLLRAAAVRLESGELGSPAPPGPQASAPGDEPAASGPPHDEAARAHAGPVEPPQAQPPSAEEPGDAAAPAPARLRPPPDAEAWYVYGIVPAQGAEALAGGSGVDPDREVVAVTAGDLAAIAGPVPLADYAPDALRERLSDQSWMAERVFAHEGVLRRCVEAGPVVPMRFATIVTDESAVRSFLGERAAVLRAALDGLRDRQEWGVKAYVDWGRLRSRLGGDPDQGGAEAGSGAAYFSRKRQQREGRARAQDVARHMARQCHEELSEVSERATLLALRDPGEGDPQGEGMVLNGAFLVAVAAVEDFHRLAAHLSSQHGEEGMRIEVTGPWPPYSFVDLAAQAAVG